MTHLRINLRHELMFFSMAGMESCWVAGLAAVILRYSETGGATLLWVSVYGLYLVSGVTARILGSKGLRRRLWIVGILVQVTTILLVKVNLYAGIGLLNPTWISQMLRRMTDLSAGMPTEILVLLLGLFIWMRGLQIPKRTIDIGIITAQFKLGMIFITAIVLMTGTIEITSSSLVVGYFALGMMVMALARIEEVARADPGGTSPFDLKWVAAIGVMFLLVGGVAFLISQVITLKTVGWVLPRFVGLVTLIYTPLFMLAGVVIEYAILPVFRFILVLFKMDPGEADRLVPPDILFPVNETVAPLIGPEMTSVKVLFVIAAVLIPFLLIIRSFHRWRMRQYAVDDNVRETVSGKGSLAQDFGDFLRDRWRRFQEAANLRRLFADSAELSARDIYVRLLSLLARQDVPRLLDQTPYEYEGIARQAMPEQQTEISAITGAYVQARYGEVEIDAEELTQLREAWQRVKAEGRVQEVE